MRTITENETESICINYLKDLGYIYLLGPDISPEGPSTERLYNEVILVKRLKSAIKDLTP